MTEETHTQAQKREAERIAELRAVLDGDECVHLTADGTLYFCGRQKSVDEKRNVELLAEIERRNGLWRSRTDALQAQIDALKAGLLQQKLEKGLLAESSNFLRAQLAKAEAKLAAVARVFDTAAEDDDAGDALCEIERIIKGEE